MADEKPKLKVAFLGDGFAGGVVPLSIVTSKLQALQQAVYHAAAAAAGHRGERRGPWFNRYRQSAELAFAAAHHSDLTIDVELAANPAFGEAFDLGVAAVDVLFDVANALESDDRPQTAPPLSASDREFVIRAIEGLMPNLGDQYRIRLENGRPGRHRPVTFDGTSRLRTRAYTADVGYPFEAEEVIIVGELIKIHVDAGDDKITVRSRRRDVDCFYSDALRDQVTNLIAGSTVEVTGFATLDSAGQPDKLHRTIDIRQVSMDPLRIARFEDAGDLFILETPIVVGIEYTDGLWVYHHPDLNLWGYAPRREDALRELHQSFAYVYREIGQESAENLDPVARRLRDRLRQLVQRPTRKADHA